MKKALILGLGISGRSAAAYLKAQGVSLVGVDREEHSLDFPTFRENHPSLPSFLGDSDALIKSPGISWEHPLVKEAQGKIPILSECEIALRALKGTKKRVFAITGSNGKTTTTALTAHVLNARGHKAIACGNIGFPLLSAIHSEADILVAELSSYQIESSTTKGIDAAVVLNITPNHLERYPSFREYGLAKLHIKNLLKEGGKFFVQKKIAESFLLDSYLSFPSLKIEEKVASIFPLRYRDGRFSHDYENCQAAFALCHQLHISEKEFWHATGSFVKPPHRLEFVRQINGVTFINDSKATSVDAVIKGVDSCPGDLILIAGGLDKGGSYKEWSLSFRGKVKKVFLIGKAQDKIFEEISKDLPAEKVGFLDVALKKAQAMALPGETVLFSPGCSSFDQYMNFEHRGEIFKKLVEEI